MANQLRVPLLLVSYVLFQGAGVLGRPQTTFQQMLPKAPMSVESFPPVTTVVVTNKPCNLRALPRIKDESYCDKYYVCSGGFYVGIFCPVGMAFDYNLQECHLRDKVDCTGRPQFAFEKDSMTLSNGISSPIVAGTVAHSGMTPTSPASGVSGTTTTTTTLRPGEIVKTTTPDTTFGTTPTMRTTKRRVTAPISVTTPASPTSTITPGPQQMFPMTSQTNVMTLQFGARVTIPAGSAIVLPPGTRIQMETETSQLSAGSPDDSFGQVVLIEGQHQVQRPIGQTTAQKQGNQTRPLISISGQTGQTHGRRPGHHSGHEHSAQQTLQRQPSITIPSTIQQHHQHHQHHHDPLNDETNKQEMREFTFDSTDEVISKVHDPNIESPISFQGPELFDTLKIDD